MASKQQFENLAKGRKGRPKTGRTSKNINIANELWDDIDNIAKSIVLTKSQTVEVLIKKALGKFEIAGKTLTELEEIINNATNEKDN